MSMKYSNNLQELLHFTVIIVRIRASLPYGGKSNKRVAVNGANV